MKVSTGGNEGLMGITLQVREPQGRNRWDSGTDSIVWKKEDLQIRKGQFMSPASHTPLFCGVFIFEKRLVCFGRSAHVLFKIYEISEYGISPGGLAYISFVVVYLSRLCKTGTVTAG